MQRFHMFEQTQIVLQVFREAEAWIENDPLSRNPHRLTLVHALGEKRTHFPGHVLVPWIVLHIAGLAEHMHQTHRKPRGRRCIKRTITTQ